MCLPHICFPGSSLPFRERFVVMGVQGEWRLFLYVSLNSDLTDEFRVWAKALFSKIGTTVGSSVSLSGLKGEALVLKSKSIMRNGPGIKHNVWIPLISEFQAVRTLFKFVFKSLMPWSRSESMWSVFSKQEYSEDFRAWLSGMPVSWRITVILYIKENANFWQGAELPCF